MVGIPGSGKSVLANAIRAKEGSILIEPDAFRALIVGTTYNVLAEDLIWAHVKIAARIFLRQQYQNVIIDATNTSLYARRAWITLAQEEHCGISSHVVLTPLPIALERNNQRPFPVPEEYVTKSAQKFFMPDLEDGFSYIYIYNNRQNVIGWAGNGSKPHHNTENYYTLTELKTPYKYPIVIEQLQEKVLEP